ncbi:MAG TPA: protein kinase [Steroidobacteraceae bacterium]|nr:protein kinase [Steroidobacteraceae bacterium]
MLVTGQSVRQYRVLEVLGRGAMGVVYRAQDENLERIVAMKEMSAEIQDDPDFVERFRQEARSQAALNHPNVAVLFDFFIHEGSPVTIMEFIEGETLDKIIKRRGPIPSHVSVPLFKQALEGVGAAHRAGIIHRDLKPSNLIVSETGQVKVMDFGVAKRQDAAGPTSTIVGTLSYMAPEQILGRSVDSRTDIYAMGITLYQMLAGRVPTPHMDEYPEPPTVHYPLIPEPVVAAVMRALARNPAMRFQSAEAFIQALPLEIPSPMSMVAATPTLPPATAAAPDATVVRKRVAYDRTVRRAPAPEIPASAPVPVAPTAAAVASSDEGRRRPSRLPIAGSIALATLLIAGAALYMAQRRSEATKPMPMATSVTPPARQAPVRSALAPSQVPGPTRPSAEPVTPKPERLAADLSSSPEPKPLRRRAPVIHAAHEAAAASYADFSGSWTGDYVDGTGARRVHVVKLDIQQGEGGGIQGILNYSTDAGATGSCKLRSSTSLYAAASGTLALVPIACNPDCPKELRKNLRFLGVNPHLSSLAGGHLEPDTGDTIQVNLRRLKGAAGENPRGG